MSQAEIELAQLEGVARERADRERQRGDGLGLEMSKLQQEQREARRLLNLATPRADRDGVLTWALTEEGVAIRKGDVIARVADLQLVPRRGHRLRRPRGRVVRGLPVTVKVNDDTLEGTVAAVLPTIQNGAITVHVALEDPSSPLLRSNLRVDVGIVTARKPRVVRIKRGPFAAGEGAQQVFVVRGDRAVRTPVALGFRASTSSRSCAGCRRATRPSSPT